MSVAFDASILIYVIDANARPPSDPSTGKPVERCQARVEWLLKTLQQQNGRIVIPTPALAEVLVKAGRGGPRFLASMNKSRYFNIVAFDERAAVEFAARQVDRLESGRSQATSSRTKAKFDDQIVAIASVEGVSTIYSDDDDLKRLSSGRFDVVKIKDLPLPPEDPQGELELEKDRGAE